MRADLDSKFLRMRVEHEEEIALMRERSAACLAKYEALREQHDGCDAALGVQIANQQQLEAELKVLRSDRDSDKSKWTQERAAWDLERTAWKEVEAKREADREAERIQCQREIAEAKEGCAQEISSCNALRYCFLFSACHAVVAYSSDAGHGIPNLV